MAAARVQTANERCLDEKSAIARDATESSSSSNNNISNNKKTKALQVLACSPVVLFQCSPTQLLAYSLVHCLG